MSETQQKPKKTSFWGKLAISSKKKHIQEVLDFEEETKTVLGARVKLPLPPLTPENYDFSENERVMMVKPESLKSPSVVKLLTLLQNWIDTELADHRIIVKDRTEESSEEDGEKIAENLVENIFDGHVLHKLWEKLSSRLLGLQEIVLNSQGQQEKLKVILTDINSVMGFNVRIQPKWTVQTIHSKNLIPIVHLLVALARHFRAPIRLPENVFVSVVIVKKNKAELETITYEEQLTTTYDEVGMLCEPDIFDTLFDQPPEKLEKVVRSLMIFVNKNLEKLHFEVTDMAKDLRDGVFLCFLMGLLGGFFVPLYEFHMQPENEDQMIHNVGFAFDLMRELDLPKPKARPEDIVNMDLKSIIRVIYTLFHHYHNSPRD